MQSSVLFKLPGVKDLKGFFCLFFAQNKNTLHYILLDKIHKINSVNLYSQCVFFTLYARTVCRWHSSANPHVEWDRCCVKAKRSNSFVSYTDDAHHDYIKSHNHHFCTHLFKFGKYIFSFEKSKEEHSARFPSKCLKYKIYEDKSASFMWKIHWCSILIICSR